MSTDTSATERPVRDMQPAWRGARMAKWRRWAEEMRAAGWTVEEPERQPGK